ncbi:bifunctional metallophosphatase/5'-nucleotidase [Thermithiobacillus tepidarius DSM 3134]|uniref:bifunctional metallophosphatase/5'-nucleotidase n=1 Tax=Thermithiobacillus tepidarius TaxID=929 RepID=UPI00040529D1|nr:bifunctional metallophosphatase/5'-nucleotidase [Thermithiobacillus tepidarius]
MTNNKLFRAVSATLAASLAVAALAPAAVAAPAMMDKKWENKPQMPKQQEKTMQLTLLQMGDIHGHLIPRAHLRSDGNGAQWGGLAYMYSKIQELRAKNPNTLLFNTGDTIQGSAEALYTKGQALVDVLDHFGIVGFAPGNWDYLYGAERFVELFGNGRWGGVAANVYYDPAVYPDKAGQTVLPPYRILNLNGLKIGLMGLSTERITLAPGPFATAGFIATSEGEEVPGIVDTLRNQEKVDLVIMVSEFGLAKNVQFGEKYAGIDVILSSDMHEETSREPVVTRNGTIVTEVGQDGTRLGQIDLDIRNGKIANWKYTFHTIDSSKIKPHPKIAALIKQKRREFVAGRGFKAHINPFNGMVLKTPIDTVVGKAEVPLYRANFSDENMPGAVEGTSHDFIADAFRDQAGADIGHMRGFRYGTHVAPGDIKLEDLYHYIAIGPQVAKTTITGQMLKDDLENNADGSFNPDTFKWTGGWQQALSGVKYDLDLYASKGNRVQNVQILNRTTGQWEALDAAKSYTYAGYWYDQAPKKVGALISSNPVTPVKGAKGEVLDGTAVVVNYLKTHTANPEQNRIRLLNPLPAPVYGNPEIQPLQGVSTAY